MIRLKKLSLKNIRSYRNQEFVFPEGSLLLSGDIGSGKTSILLSIEYALFGLQPGQRGTSLLSNGEDVGEVALELDINGKEIIIERALKRGSKTVSQDYAAITIDGKKEEISVTELKTKIISLLNYPEEFVKKTNLLYRYTVYSPQEEMKQIILEAPEERLNVLRHVFGVDKYKKIQENLSIITLKLREKSKSLQAETKDIEEIRSKVILSEGRIIELEEKTAVLNKSLDLKILNRKDLEEKVKEIEIKIKEKQSFEKEVEKTAIFLKTKEESISNIKFESEAIKKYLAEERKEFNQKHFDEIISLISKKKEIIEFLSNNQIEISSQINSIKSRKQEDLSKKERIFKIDLCPTCLQNVPDNHKHNILNDAEVKIADFDKKIKEFGEKLLENQTQLANEKKYLEELERSRRELEILKVKSEQIESRKEKLASLELSLAALEKDIVFLKNHMQTLKNSIFEFSKFDNLFRVKKEELLSLLQDEKMTEIELAQLKRESELTKKSLTEWNTKLAEKEEMRNKATKVSRIESWLSNDFSELISFTERNIMIKLREEFSNSFNKWFTLLTSDSFSAQLDENFTPVVMQGGFELEYSYLSGGERTAVALSYRLALNQIINSVFSQINTKGLVILDEPTDGFSEQQLDKVRDILQELNSEQLVLVSHEQKIEGFVDNVIRLKKEDGASRITEKLK